MAVDYINYVRLSVSPVVVGLHIEISNRFLHDLEATIAKQCKTRSCHKSPFIKGGFRGNVNVSRSRPTPATKTGETLLFLLL